MERELRERGRLWRDGQRWDGSSLWLGSLRVGGLGHQAEGEDVGGVEFLVGELAAGELVGEVEAVDEGGGVHPVVGGDVVAGGREGVVEAHAHGVDGVDEGAGVLGVGGGGAEGGGEELHGGLDLVAEVLCGVELGRLDEGAEDGFDVAVGGEVGGGHAVDEGGGWVVGDEALGELVTDEVRGFGAGGEDVEGGEAFVHSFARWGWGSAATPGMVWPSHCLGPGSCFLGSKRNGPAWLGRSTPQPVRMAARAVTSAWV